MKRQAQGREEEDPDSAIHRPNQSLPSTRPHKGSRTSASLVAVAFLLRQVGHRVQPQLFRDRDRIKARQRFERDHRVRLGSLIRHQRVIRHDQGRQLRQTHRQLLQLFHLFDVVEGEVEVLQGRGRPVVEGVQFVPTEVEEFETAGAFEAG